jgi:hypothetical protein
MPERIGKYMVGLDRLGHVVDRVAHFTDDLVVFDIDIPSGADVLADRVVAERN